MNKNILTRNLIILKQFQEIAGALRPHGIPVITLKGMALIQAIPEYMGERVMEDMDLLFRPEDICRVRSVLFSLGYATASEDPWAFCRDGAIAYVDIIDRLWYMNAREMRELRKRARAFPLSETACFLPPDELYLHTLAHAAVHHARHDTKWQKDLAMIRRRWPAETSPSCLENKLKNYGLKEAYAIYSGEGNSAAGRERCFRWLFESSLRQKGHILRFAALPFKKKIRYALSSLFPSYDFLRYRYGLQNDVQITAYRLARPFLLFLQLLKACLVSNSPARLLSARDDTPS